MRVILKLGGALITDKSKGAFDIAKSDVIERVAREIAEVVKEVKDLELILVHGAGSFGHPYVKEYGIDNPRGVSMTHLACERLCEIVCRALLKEGVNVAPVHPFTAFRIDADMDGVNCVKFDKRLFEELMQEFTPVTHGDVVLSYEGWKVLSGDDIAVTLAKEFKAERVGFATNTEIIFKGKPAREFSLKYIDCLDSVDKKKTDVTGGMKGKLRKVSAIAGKSEVFIFSGLREGNVSAFLRGEEVGTRIIP